MKVKILRSLTASVDGDMVSMTEGQILDTPAGAGLVKAGLAVALEEDAETAANPSPEAAVIEPAETAVPPAARKRKPK